MVRSSRSSELDCANGDGCDDIKSSVNMLHWFQVRCVVLCRVGSNGPMELEANALLWPQLAAVWVILWVYHKVEARPEDPEDSD